VDLKHLVALVTVAEVGSVTKAAELLHLVQPAVTRQIRTLEDELGVALFERTRQGMRLTESGAVMVDRARRALAELDRARAEIRPEAGPVHGIVTLGILESVVDLLAERLVTTVRERHPGVELRILTAYSGHLQEWLDKGDLDLSLLYNLASTPSLHVVPLLDEQLWAVGPPGAGLDPDHPISWTELATRPLVLPVPGHGLRVLVDQARASLGLTLDVVAQTNALMIQRMLVLAGHGWTVLPAAGVAYDVREGLVSGTPLRDPVVTRQLVLGVPRTGRTPPAVEAVAAAVMHLVGGLVRTGQWPSARPVAVDEPNDFT
jgi:DNA-binding transcriptional LysR family regulator